MGEGRRRLIIVMGVSGCGKSTIAEGLAGALGGRFFDGDHFHPQANIDKMSRGEPLTDEDRWPWLDALGAAAPKTGRVVIACSALRRVYRERLAAAAGEGIAFIHMAGTKDLIAERMKTRSGHFMPPALMDSQFATLEPLEPDERGLTLNIENAPEALIEDALRALKEI